MVRRQGTAVLRARTPPRVALPLDGVAGCIRHLRATGTVLIEDVGEGGWLAMAAAFATPDRRAYLARVAGGPVLSVAPDGVISVPGDASLPDTACTGDAAMVALRLLARAGLPGAMLLCPLRSPQGGMADREALSARTDLRATPRLRLTDRAALAPVR